MLITTSIKNKKQILTKFIYQTKLTKIKKLNIFKKERHRFKTFIKQCKLY